MIAPRTILTRAALLLGATLLLAILTGAAPFPAHRTPILASACEPDGTSVATAFGWNRLEYELNEYARPRGYSVTLSMVAARREVAGYVVALALHRGTPDREATACFYVPATVPPSEAVPYVWRRTAETMAQLDRVVLWTDND